jgi:hypothetical protein
LKDAEHHEEQATAESSTRILVTRTAKRLWAKSDQTAGVLAWPSVRSRQAYVRRRGEGYHPVRVMHLLWVPLSVVTLPLGFGAELRDARG